MSSHCVYLLMCQHEFTALLFCTFTFATVHSLNGRSYRHWTYYIFPATDVSENDLVAVVLIGSQRLQSLHLDSFYIGNDMQYMALKHDGSNTCLKYVIHVIHKVCDTFLYN